jgi:hypothetical protein
MAHVGTVLIAMVIMTTTGNMVTWAVQAPRIAAGGIRFMAVFMRVWIIYLALGGAVSLGLGADEFARGHADGWEGVVDGALAVACCPVAIGAYRVFNKRRRGGPPEKQAGRNVM